MRSKILLYFCKPSRARLPGNGPGLVYRYIQPLTGLDRARHCVMVTSGVALEKDEQPTPHEKKPWLPY